jgi:hypothetical protein
MDREDRIRKRAYRIWEDEGCPDGRDRDHWDRAARDVGGEATGTERTRDRDPIRRGAVCCHGGRC